MCCQSSCTDTQKKQKERKTLLGVKPLRPDLQHGTDRFFPQHCFLGNVRHEYGLSGEKSRSSACFCCQVNPEWDTRPTPQIGLLCKTSIKTWCKSFANKMCLLLSPCTTILYTIMCFTKWGERLFVTDWAFSRPPLSYPIMIHHLCDNPSTSALGVPISPCCCCLCCQVIWWRVEWSKQVFLNISWLSQSFAARVLTCLKYQWSWWY